MGPISLFIENVLGLREVNALERRIVWTPNSLKTNGIRNLKIGGAPVTLMARPEEGVAEVTLPCPFTLTLNGTTYALPKGHSTLTLHKK